MCWISKLGNQQLYYYTLFDMTAISSGCKGYAGAAYDGRYIYFSPADASSSTIVRFDTTLSFRAVSSYTTLDLSVFGSCSGYIGCIFDGRSIYFAPYNNSALFGLFVRIDAYPGPQATAITAGLAPNGFAIGTYAGSGQSYSTPAYDALVVSGKVGIGVAAPAFALELATDSAAKPTGGVWATFSDVRIKRNIQDIPDALLTMSQLRPRKFTYHPAYAKDISADPKQIRYGFIADEVEKTVEGCVQGSAISCYNGKMKEWFDQGAMGEMPKPLPGLTNLKSFNMNNILIYYIQTIKELADIQDRLKNKIDKFKNR